MNRVSVLTNSLFIHNPNFSNIFSPRVFSTYQAFHKKLTNVTSHNSNTITPHKSLLERLSTLQRPSAKKLIQHLSSSNPLMFETKGTSLVSYILSEKAIHPDKVLLIRVGEFYESFGIDSIMLIEYAGLNPMGGKPRAGCPKYSIQATLDNLTGAGLVCCVYEELSYVTTITQNSKGIKARRLAQIISQENPIYMQEGMCLTEGDVPYSASRPIFSLFYSVSDGFSLAEIYIDERKMYIFDSLTLEATKIKLESGKGVSIYIHSDHTQKALDIVRNYSSILRKYFLRDFKSSLEFHKSSLQKVSSQMGIPLDNFITISSNLNNISQPYPLCYSTAQNLGLLSLSEQRLPGHIKGLHEHLLPEDSISASKQLVKTLLLNPPPPDITSCIQSLNSLLTSLNFSIPQVRPIPAGKLVSHISYRSGNRNFFIDIAELLEATLFCLETYPSTLISNIFSIFQHFTKTTWTVEHKIKIKQALELIYSVIPTQPNDLPSEGSKLEILEEFFQRMESFRGKVKPNKLEIEYEKLKVSAINFYHVILEDFGGLENIKNSTELKNLSSYLSQTDIFELNKNLILDSLNNGIFLKKIPKHKQKFNDNNLSFERPLDRNGRSLSKYWTTKRVSLYTYKYINQCRKLIQNVCEILEYLNNSLKEYLSFIVDASSLLLILKTFSDHVSHAQRLFWNLPTLSDKFELIISNLIPYDIQFEPIPTNVTLSGLILLTGHNMAGKSCLGRSTLALTLMANTGFYCPCGQNSYVPRYNAFISACTMAHDAPEQNRSLYANEMEQIRILLNDATNKSFIFIDEPCKGTSPKCGSAFVGSLLEELDKRQTHGIISTHLHEELTKLPLYLPTISYKKMGAKFISNTDIEWNYQLEDGICTESFGLITANKMGISEGIVKRAAELENKWEEKKISKIFQSHNAQSKNENYEKFSFKPEYNDSIQSIFKILFNVCQSNTKINTHILNSNQIPPPIFQKYSCVYLIIKGLSNLKLEALVPPQISIYIGESDNIIKRLKTHFSKNKDNKNDKAIIISVSDKSLARFYESKLIMTFKKHGYDIISELDGTHKYFAHTSK